MSFFYKHKAIKSQGADISENKAMVERKQLKKILNVILFIILFILYYFLYMESALTQYYENRTTIVQSREKILDPESPVLLLCPNPPFKASYFKNQGLDEFGHHERFFWIMHDPQNLVQNGTAEPIDIYMNMSYILGSDFKILVYQFKLSFLRLHQHRCP